MKGSFTRAQIDKTVEALTATDLIKAMSGTDDGGMISMAAFNSAAERIGLVGKGESATDKVAAQDTAYLITAVGGAMRMDNPLSEGQKD